MLLYYKYMIIFIFKYNSIFEYVGVENNNFQLYNSFNNTLNVISQDVY
jgi:hypothetical protein